MPDRASEITDVILRATEQARNEVSDEPEPGFTGELQWPVECLVGPGLEGAIACETKIGYVNGTKGHLIYRGYDVFDQEKVGFVHDVAEENGTRLDRFDTSLPGNSNSGHIYAVRLPDEEKDAIVEYLKTF